MRYLPALPLLSCTSGNLGSTGNIWPSSIKNARPAQGIFLLNPSFPQQRVVGTGLLTRWLFLGSFPYRQNEFSHLPSLREALHDARQCSFFDCLTDEHHCSGENKGTGMLFCTGESPILLTSYFRVHAPLTKECRFFRISMVEARGAEYSHSVMDCLPTPELRHQINIIAKAIIIRFGRNS
jgi:hypothetical protein